MHSFWSLFLCWSSLPRVLFSSVVASPGAALTAAASPAAGAQAPGLEDLVVAALGL